MPLYVRDQDGTVMAAADQIVWGDDTNLYRSDPDTLKTDDSLIVGAVLTVLGDAAFSGTVTGIDGTAVGLENVDNTADVDKPISTPQQTALDLKAPLASPTFTGTVSGVSKAAVGLSSVDNTADVDKPVSTAQATADLLRVLKAGDTMTGLLALAAGAAGVGGLTIGADVSLYRSGSNQLATDDRFVVIRQTAGDIAHGILVNTGTIDVNYRHSVTAAGMLSWGNGTLVVDTNLYRLAAASLKTDGALTVGGLLALAAGAADVGGLTIGGDVNLYRSAADTLKTDDALVVGGVLTPLSHVKLSGTSNFEGRYLVAIANTGAYLETDPIGGLKVSNRNGAAYVPFTIAGMAAQSGDLQRWTNSAAAVLASISSTGLLALPAGAAGVGGLTIGTDVNLYRSAADTLKTDDRFEAALGITAGVTTEATSKLSKDGSLSHIYSANVQTYRDLGSYYSNVNATGTMKIALPKTWSNPSLNIVIRGYSYTGTGSAWSLNISGDPNTSNSGGWLYTQATITGPAPFSSVRLAHDGTKVCILLGNMTTVWAAYSTVTINEVTATYAPTGWGSGYALSVLGSETGITNIVTPKTLVLGQAAGPSSQLGLLFEGDTNLYRSASNELKTDDSLIVGDAIRNNSGALSTYFVTSTAYQNTMSANGWYSGGAWNVIDAALPGWRFDLAAHNTDASDKFSLHYRAAAAAANAWTEVLTVRRSGYLGLGNNAPSSRLGFVAGTTAADGITFGTDTNLYRSAANQLKTDDSLIVSGTLYSVGSIAFGISSDTVLYRSAANALRTDGVLDVGGVLRPGRFTTALRPTAAAAGVGGNIYDTTLSKPIWSDGTVWRDAVGTAV
jgi:hypothetical protein